MKDKAEAKIRLCKRVFGISLKTYLEKIISNIMPPQKMPKTSSEGGIF